MHYKLADCDISTGSESWQTYVVRENLEDMIHLRKKTLQDMLLKSLLDIRTYIHSAHFTPNISLYCCLVTDSNALKMITNNKNNYKSREKLTVNFGVGNRSLSWQSPGDCSSSPNKPLGDCFSIASFCLNRASSMKPCSSFTRASPQVERSEFDAFSAL